MTHAQESQFVVTRPKDVTAPTVLPDGAKDIWQSAFLSAYDGTCKGGGRQDDREGCSAAVAWSAVKEKYRQNEDGDWVQKSGGSGDNDPDNGSAPYKSLASILLKGRATDPASSPAPTPIDFDAQFPAPLEGTKPVVPTPENLTRAEQDLWDRVYTEALQGECSQEDSPNACAARAAWAAVKAVRAAGQELEIEPEAEAEDVYAEGEEEEVSEGEESVAEDEDEDEEEDVTEDEAEGEEPTGAPDLEATMSKIAAGEELSDSERETLSAAVDAAKEGETDEAKINALNEVMAKIGRNEPLSDEEQQLLSAALSAVQEKSLATRAEESEMVKRTYTQNELKAMIVAGRAMPDGRFPIISRADLKNAVSAVERGVADSDVLRHVVVRAGSLKMLDALPGYFMNHPTAKSIGTVDEQWLSDTVERMAKTAEERAWLATTGEETLMTRPDYIESSVWASMPSVEKTARAEYLRRLVQRLYEQAADDLRVQGWRSRPVYGREHELEFRGYTEHEQGPLFVRAILVRPHGQTHWVFREVSRGASLSTAVAQAGGEFRR